MCATSAGVKSVALGLSTTGSALASVCECHSILAFSATYKSKNANLTTLVGELALIDGSTRTASVMTAATCRCLVLPKSSFQEFLHARPNVALRLLTALAERVRRLTDEVERLALRDVYGRLVDTLNARAVDEDGRLITDALTQRDLAALVGASREMVSRIFKDLKAGGYISLEGKRVVIQRRLPEHW
jgi:CRP/FNR family cyclic AMP-dependent transcriptional regulator